MFVNIQKDRRFKIQKMCDRVQVYVGDLETISVISVSFNFKLYWTFGEGYY